MRNEVKIEAPRAQTVVTRFTVHAGEMNVIGEIIHVAFLAGAGVQPVGPPYARALWQPGHELEVGIPVSAPFAGTERVICAEPPGGKFAVAWHTGPFDQLRGAHEAIHE
jgi:hypothetical protein